MTKRNQEKENKKIRKKEILNQQKQCVFTCQQYTNEKQNQLPHD